MWIGVENLPRNRRCAELKAVLGITYRPVGNGAASRGLDHHLMGVSGAMNS
jgi:hypothetical protein